MRQAGIIQDAERARLFGDYLLSQGITNKVDEAQGGWAVWVHDDDKLAHSRDELQKFLLNPGQGKYREAREQAEAIRRQQQQDQRQHARNIVDVRRRWRPWTEGRFPVTWALIVLSVALSLATSFGSSDWADDWLYIVRAKSTKDRASLEGRYWRVIELRDRHKRLLGYLGYDNLSEIRQGQIWRLITPAFLQVGGWLHLIFNMYWLYMAGALVETRRGSLTMAAVALATAVISNLVQFYWAGPLFGGMSGVGFGLFGYVWMKSRYDPASGIYVSPDLVVQFLFWLVLCMTDWIGPIANAAHVAGMLSGMTIGLALPVWRKLR